jgi:hypothetical protein
MSLFEASRCLSIIVEVSRGLPHAQRVLLMAIAAKWDPETELSGERPRHSYQSLRELMEVEGSQGRAAERYSKDRIRRALRTLHRAGLIEWAGELVFKVPALSQEKSVQKRWATTWATKKATPPGRENGEYMRHSKDDQSEVGHEVDHEVGHTSYTDDDDISGAVIYPTEFHQGGVPQLPFAAFFQSQGFSRKQIIDASDTLQDWSARGVTHDLVKHVVALVDDRLRNQGNERPWSPKYYDREIRRRLNRESSGRSDAGAGPGGGDEIDSALGPLH